MRTSANASRAKGVRPVTVRQTVVGGLLFAHDERVLAPRAWTREQAAWARELLATAPEGSVLELCSGAGHIGLLTLLGNERRLVMVDSSLAACEFARANAAYAGLTERVEVRHRQLDAALAPREIFPLILADPPWVASSEVDRFPEDPAHAIDGGPDGLRVTRACLAVIGAHLHEEGFAVLQVGSADQADGVAWFVHEHPDLRLTTGETRSFPGRGSLVLLSRPRDAS
jgi:release factor glutamine methyltransferase